MFQRTTHQMLRFLTKEDGLTTVEYAVVLALVVGACIGAVVLLGSGSSDLFTSAGSSIGTSVGTTIGTGQ